MREGQPSKVPHLLLTALILYITLRDVLHFADLEAESASVFFLYSGATSLLPASSLLSSSFYCCLLNPQVVMTCQAVCQAPGPQIHQGVD